VVAIESANFAGLWGGRVELRDIRGSTYVGIRPGLRDGITMSIHHAGGMAVLQIRQGYFGRMCGPTLSVDSRCGVGVCQNTLEIALDASCNSYAWTTQFVSTDVYRKLPVDPYMLDPGVFGNIPQPRSWHMGSDAIHMDFWTHACQREVVSGGYRYQIDIEHKRHWALWMDTAGTIEVRYVLQPKPGRNEFYWFVAGSLERCGNA
jgi:hypothetical protein